MFEFHSNKEKYFQFQYFISRDYIHPFVEEYFEADKKLNVLEIGSAEAGVLKAFTEKGHQCLGIELQPNRVELAKKFLEKEYNIGQIDFMAKNIYDIDVEKDLDNKFDLIILKDVIEHIHDQEKFLPKLLDFLAPGGKVFFAYPPWYMPYGGHQQVCESKFLSKLPYWHLLPMPLFKSLMKAFGESQVKIDNVVEIKETGISIERFERISKSSGFSILKKQFYFTNPIYKYKFGVKTRKQIGLISAIPFIRNFFTTCVYYVVESKSDSKS